MTPVALRKTLLLCAIFASSTMVGRLARAESELPIATDQKAQPKAAKLTKKMLQALKNAEDYVMEAERPAPPLELAPGELPPPPPPSAPAAAPGVDDQDTEGADEKGVAVSDRTLCPNPQILATQLVIHHLYIGQGDSTFIRTPGGNTTILIDGGESGHQVEIMSALARCYRLNNVDYVVLSHPHSDHFGGLLELLKHTPEGFATLSPAQQKTLGGKPDFQVNRGVFVTGFGPGPIKGGLKNDKALGNKLKGFLDIAQAIDSARMKSGALAKQSDMFIPYGDKVFLGKGRTADPVKFDVVVANGETANKSTVDLLNDKGELKDPNSTSAGIHIKFGNFDYFTSGDLSGGKPKDTDSKDGKTSVPAVEHALVLSKLIGKMDVVKANHHGSDTSNSKEFMDMVDPLIYLISAGDAGFNTSSFHLPRVAPVIDMHAQVSKKNGFILQTSCGAGNVMPNHPFCQALLPMDIAAEHQAAKGRNKVEFNYQKGLARDGKTEIAGGILNLPNYLNAQGDIVLTTDGSQYFLLVPHNPRPRTAPRLIKVTDGSMPAIDMAPETPVALGPFKATAK